MASVELAGAGGLRCIGIHSIGIHSTVLVPKCFSVLFLSSSGDGWLLDGGEGVGKGGKGSM